MMLTLPGSPGLTPSSFVMFEASKLGSRHLTYMYKPVPLDRAQSDRDVPTAVFWVLFPLPSLVDLSQG